MRKAPSTPLENVRRTRTLNQQQLAKLLGISQQTLSKYEKGKLMPTPDMQARIAAILGVARHEIFPTEAIAS